jgi:hypothetical protein
VSAGVRLAPYRLGDGRLYLLVGRALQLQGRSDPAGDVIASRRGHHPNSPMMPRPKNAAIRAQQSARETVSIQTAIAIILSVG